MQPLFTLHRLVIELIWKTSGQSFLFSFFFFEIEMFCCHVVNPLNRYLLEFGGRGISKQLKPSRGDQMYETSVPKILNLGKRRNRVGNCFETF